MKIKLNLLYTFIVLSALGFLYRRFIDKHNYAIIKKDKKYLKEFLDNHYDGEYNMQKPVAWIYLPFERNSQKWTSFYSRSNTNINNTVLQAVIKHNTEKLREHFNVLLIDDSSFKYLLDTVVDGENLKTLGNPLKSKIIDLYFLQLIENYGGIRIPNHFIVKQPNTLFNMMNETTKNDIVCFKKPHANVFIYDTEFVGSLFHHNEIIQKLIYFQQMLINGDSTHESNFKATSVPHLVEENIVKYDLSASGVMDTNGRILEVEDLMSESKRITMPSNSFMYYIPLDQLSKRNHYNWITYIASLKGNAIYELFN